MPKTHEKKRAFFGPRLGPGWQMSGGGHDKVWSLGEDLGGGQPLSHTPFYVLFADGRKIIDAHTLSTGGFRSG